MIERILIVHNGYRFKGGEDAVVEAEAAMLAARGHTVDLFTRHNDEIDALPALRLAVNTIWSGQSADEFARCLQRFQPQLIHVHNIFPLISPSIYWVAEAHGIPVVQTLHNFRLLCPQAMLLRDGSVCEKCVGTVPWRAVVHGCYRDSRAQSAVVAMMLSAHRLIGTWQKKVTRYIALSEFGRARFIAGGLPAERIVVKPNFVEEPGACAEPQTAPREHFLFVGRLAPEKGLAVLSDAAQQAGARVTVAGDGPDADFVAGKPGLLPLGRLGVDEVRQQMRRAIALIVPSICYETFGLVIIEAYACGLPVIASRIGGFSDLVSDGETGLLFAPGDAAELARKMRWAMEHPADMARMGSNARRVYEERFTAQKNYAQLMAIYADAVNDISELEPKKWKNEKEQKC